jgi:hypothetical protein
VLAEVGKVVACHVTTTFACRNITTEHSHTIALIVCIKCLAKTLAQTQQPNLVLAEVG